MSSASRKPARSVSRPVSGSDGWINGDIGIDAAGNLYATWDTQGSNTDGSANDIGWLSFATDHGAHWSAPVQAPADRLNVPHIMEVTGGGRGTSGWPTCGRRRWRPRLRWPRAGTAWPCCPAAPAPLMGTGSRAGG